MAITKKISRKMPRKFLGVLYAQYTERHGYGVRHLGEFKILTTATELYIELMPEIAETEEFQEAGQRVTLMRARLLDLILELEARGYLRSTGDGLTYLLTPEGYDEADRTGWQRFVGYWNSNPGLNTLIALGSMVIAFASMWVAVVALSKPESSCRDAVESTRLLRLSNAQCNGNRPDPYGHTAKHESFTLSRQE